MRGRQNGERDRLVILAHQTAAMMGDLHSKSGLKPLMRYLEPPKQPSTDEGARRVLEMMKRINAKQQVVGSPTP